MYYSDKDINQIIAAYLQGQVERLVREMTDDLPAISPEDCIDNARRREELRSKLHKFISKLTAPPERDIVFEHFKAKMERFK